MFEVLKPGPASRTIAAVQRTTAEGQEIVENVVDTFERHQSCSDPYDLAPSEEAKRHASDTLVAHGIWRPH